MITKWQGQRAEGAARGGAGARQWGSGEENASTLRGIVC